MNLPIPNLLPLRQGIVRVTGLEQVLRNLKGSQTNIADRVSKGLYRAGLHLQRESQKIVPVQMGVLKNSAYTRKLGSGERTDVIVGYTASYAVFVHENPNAAHGKEFNIKHAAEIARAGKTATRKKTGKQYWRPTSKAGTARGGMFPRGENQTFKFLERPLREQRLVLFRIIRDEVYK